MNYELFQNQKQNSKAKYFSNFDGRQVKYIYNK